jgi:hypothetical protein
MAKIKLTKSVVDATTFRAKEYELRDTVVPGFLLKVTPAGRKVFMVQYRTNAGERRKPAIGLSLLKKPSGHEIGVPMKTMVDDVRCSNRAPLSCDADSPHVF